MLITSPQVQNIITPVKYNDVKLQDITNALNETFTRFNIDTPLRASHFLAQVLHESSAFRFSVEIWGNTEAQKRYDTRVDLGNTPALDGDGFKYRGRGWIQMTGKTNYRMAGVAFGQDFLTHPELLGKEPWDSLAAGWFWNRRKLNAFADADDVVTITKKINGGFNGLNDRRMWLQKAKQVLIG
jgi:putative chitinase